jgi:hypothetical protein
MTTTIGAARPLDRITRITPNMPGRDLQRWMRRLQADHPVLGALSNIDPDDRPLA